MSGNPTASSRSGTAYSRLRTGNLIREASAKIRTGAPVDDEEDYALDTWAGVLPLHTVAGTPQPDARLSADIAVPGYVSAYTRLRAA